jgi:hypothetical protein
VTEPDCSRQNTTLIVPKSDRVQLTRAGFYLVKELYDAQRNVFGGGTCLRIALSPAPCSYAVGLPFYDFGRLVWTMALADSIAGTTDYQNITLDVLPRTQLNEWVLHIRCLLVR